MNPRFYDIAESNHVFQYPINLETVLSIGRNLGLHEGKRVLDLACGKGELLIQWAHEFNVLGVGVDSNADFIAHAKHHANQIDSAGINIVQDDPAEYPQPFHEFDAIVCMRVGWLADTLSSALALMTPALREHPDSRIIIGEPFWNIRPIDADLMQMGAERDALRTLDETLTEFDRADLNLLDFIQTEGKDWDAYESAQWRAVHQWLLDHPDDPDAMALKQWNADNRRQYLRYGRQFIGWGVFVLG